MNNIERFLIEATNGIGSVGAPNEIIIKLASPARIRSWSHGEIIKPLTINYRTLQPEMDGLFCCRIFGPIKDFECLCGKYKQIRFKGSICEKCGVEITASDCRRKRMAHIGLAIPVFHIWYLKSSTLAIEATLNLTPKELEQIVYFEAFIVITPGNSPLKRGSIVSEEDLLDHLDQYGKDFQVGIGAEGIKRALEDVNLTSEIKKIKEKLKSNKRLRGVLVKKLRALESMREFDVQPAWMVLEILPILPPDLRPMVPLESGKFISSDLNDLYKRILIRNSRLKRLVELKAPRMVVQNEKKMLQEAVDSLIDNGRRGMTTFAAGGRPLKSLSEMLKGKVGRFRQNLLGKRVDYSGRSVITVGPDLRIQQCGIPKQMAFELFKPFIVAELNRIGLDISSYALEKRVESDDPLIYDLLSDILKNHPVLLNRAPTLHRANVQAFEAVLTEDSAIRLSPLVCASFNADFDGDQMAIHIPLSLEAQAEAQLLMLPTENFISPSNGRPSIAPTQEAILGLYLCSKNFQSESEPLSCKSIEEVEILLNNKELKIWTPIRIVIADTIKHRGALKTFNRSYITTAGHAIASRVLPSGLAFDAFNKTLKKETLMKVISLATERCCRKSVVSFIEGLTSYGFVFATIAGVSLCAEDFNVDVKKKSIVFGAWEKVRAIEIQQLQGRITLYQKYNEAIEVWTSVTNGIKNLLLGRLSLQPLLSIDNSILINPVYMIARSSARGSMEQIKQIAGIRGLMAKPDGSILEVPITSNFYEGLTTLQYFISSHGARKGLADTALRTADSGYLTRRLIDVSQDVIVTIKDCTTRIGIKVIKSMHSFISNDSLPFDCIGRVLIGDVLCDKKIIKNGTVINESVLEDLMASAIMSFEIRSPVTCEAKRGICAMCYGIDLARSKLVNLGEAVGIIAAQSIGEPGTQLTMRTFHIGGTASCTSVSSFRATKGGIVSFGPDLRVVVDRNHNTIVVSRRGMIYLVDHNNTIIENYQAPYGSLLFCSHLEMVKTSDLLCKWNQFNEPVVAEVSGLIKIDRFSFKRSRKPSQMRSSIGIIKIFSSNFCCFRVPLLNETIIKVSLNQYVTAGQVIGYVQMGREKNKDITGGLIRVTEILEVRNIKNPEILSGIEGVVVAAQNTSVSIRDRNLLTHNIILPDNRIILVREGQFIKKGEAITEGSKNMLGMLASGGVSSLVKHVVREVQLIYDSQGVKINSKHIEVVIRQMLRCVIIVSRGDTKFLEGERIERQEVFEANEKVQRIAKCPALYKNLLLGITKASLASKSFISAASFQETSKVLAAAASLGKRDPLCGLKENVIAGRIIPAGTGFIYHHFKNKRAPV